MPGKISSGKSRMTALISLETSQTSACVTAWLRKHTLYLGFIGLYVVELQSILAHRGYYFGPLDGVFDTEIEYAVQGYQQKVFLRPTGIVDQKTWQALLSGAPVNMPILRPGSFGEPVRKVQEVLWISDYYTAKIDGIFASLTLEAVQRFQLDRGLLGNGVVSEHTWNALSEMPRYVY
ncbi:MAG: peptidoglycan-binding protein [Moorea sp. SIO3C2]|nr:peptidoglycan-binding protein [Moorena sp. SIO3C2]